MIQRIKSILNLISNVIHQRDVYLPWYKKSFGNFGENTVINYPANITFRENIYIGDNTTILNNSRINIYNYLTGQNSKVKIGSNCYIAYNISILAGGNIIIGDKVLIASNVLISSENHGMSPESQIPYMDQPLSCKDVEIGDGSWLGEKVCILPGVQIGKKCIVGAGSVVTKNVPDFCIAAGNPAKIIKKYNFDLHKWEKYNG